VWPKISFRSTEGVTLPDPRHLREHYSREGARKSQASTDARPLASPSSKNGIVFHDVGGLRAACHVLVVVSDPATVSRLILKSRHELLAYLYSALPDYHAVEDAFQEVCLVAVQKPAGFRDGTNFAAWARRIARYKLREQLRKRPPDPPSLLRGGAKRDTSQVDQHSFIGADRGQRKQQPPQGSQKEEGKERQAQAPFPLASSNRRPDAQPGAWRPLIPGPARPDGSRPHFLSAPESFRALRTTEGSSETLTQTWT